MDDDQKLDTPEKLEKLPEARTNEQDEKLEKLANDSNDEWEELGLCNDYFSACVGGGEAPEIEQAWGKQGTKIWVNFRGEWYHQVLGEGRPDQWVRYIPRA